jgi:hypothetical protein
LPNSAAGKASGTYGAEIRTPLIILHCRVEIDGIKDSNAILCHAGNRKLTVWIAVLCRKFEMAGGLFRSNTVLQQRHYRR